MPRTGVFELPDLGVEAGGALVGCEEVGLQRCAGHGRLPRGGRGGFSPGGRRCRLDPDVNTWIRAGRQGSLRGFASSYALHVGCGWYCRAWAVSTFDFVMIIVGTKWISGVVGATVFASGLALR